MLETHLLYSKSRARESSISRDNSPMDALGTLLPRSPNNPTPEHWTTIHMPEREDVPDMLAASGASELRSVGPPLPLHSVCTHKHEGTASHSCIIFDLCIMFASHQHQVEKQQCRVCTERVLLYLVMVSVAAWGRERQRRRGCRHRC